MKFPFISLPKFADDVAKEIKPDYYYKKMNKEEQDEFDRNLTTQRAIHWSCKTSASAYNLCWIIIILLVMTNGLQIATIIKQVIESKLGIK